MNLQRGTASHQLSPNKHQAHTCSNPIATLSRYVKYIVIYIYIEQNPPPTRITYISLTYFVFVVVVEVKVVAIVTGVAFQLFQFATRRPSSRWNCHTHLYNTIRYNSMF